MCDPSGSNRETLPLPSVGSGPPPPDQSTSQGTFTASDLANAGEIFVGRYRIQREIAFGGMGVVYEAIQDQPRRIVALKVMRAGSGGVRSAAWAHQFQAESALLARLRHPFIAQVYEAGTEGFGASAVPFFVMEFVPGAKPLDEYCDSNKHSFAQRLELFCKVCLAVEHGHSQGVIHRDLKPANLLVDSNGTPKVIDFGIAQAADLEHLLLELRGNSPSMIGTLRYMSPEQCSGDPSTIDARSDVYSLGVVLYELLCGGDPPYELGTLAAHEASKVICQTAPVLPSQRVRGLRGELEAILLKALQKRREQRYQSVAALREDIERVLACRPIEARRDSLKYQLHAHARKFARENVLFVMVLVVAVAAAIGWLAGKPWPFQAFVGPWFERQVSRRGAALVPTPSVPPFAHVQIVTMNPLSDLKQLIDRYQLDTESVSADPAKRKSLRVLDAIMLRRALAGGARVIAFDLGFRRESEYDEPFAQAAREARKAGVPVVVIAPSWDPTRISSIIRPHVLAGGSNMHVNEGLWESHVVVRQPGGEPQLSMALRAVAADRQPNMGVVPYLDSHGQFVELGYTDPGDPSATAGASSSNAQVERFPLSRIRINPNSNPETGVQAGAQVGLLFLDVPSDDVLAKANMKYGDVLGAEPAELRKQFGGKIAVFGDPLAEKEYPHLASGRGVAGFWVTATAIDVLARGSWTRLASPMEFLGADVLAATIGVMVMYVVRQNSPAIRASIAVLIVALPFVASLFVFGRLGVLLNPQSSTVSVLLAVALAAGVARLRRPVIS